MNVRDLAALEGWKTLCLPDPDAPLCDAYTSDLLSDVMAHAPAESVLITIQAHKNTVAVASLAGAAAIVLCNGREAAEDMRAAAGEHGIALFSTPWNQYQASWRIHDALAGE
jgi:hypothetical protein